MRKSWGLFAGAISQSGGFQRWVAKPLAEAEKNYEAVAVALGCGSGAAAVECLVGKTAAELLAQSEAKRLPSTDGWDSCQWSPVIDGVELEEHPMELLRSGRVAPGIRMILGTNKDEGTSFLGYLKFGVDPLTPKYDMDEAAFRCAALRPARLKPIFPTLGPRRMMFSPASTVRVGRMMRWSWTWTGCSGCLGRSALSWMSFAHGR